MATKSKKDEEEKVEETEVETPAVEDEDTELSDDEQGSLEELSPSRPGQPGTPMAGISPIPLGSKAQAMRKKLASQPKVKVFIPLAAGEKQGVTQSVVLNGYPMYIRKGSYVDVPQSVAEVLEVKLRHKMTIENHPSRITGEGDVPMTRYGN